MAYDWERDAQAVDCEDDIVSHDVKVPSDDGAFVGVVDYTLVDLTLAN